jgi:ankyrin repeat protein
MNEENSKRLYNALVNNDNIFLTQMFKEGFDMSETVFYVPEWSVRCTPLEFAVCKNNFQMVQFLVERGVNPNVGMVNGDTPLIISIKNMSYIMSEKLIVLGANTCKPDKNGNTPLYWAVDKKNKPLINLLLLHGAELTIHTALSHAIDRNYLDFVQLLVERGAPVNVVSPKIPLTRAITKGHSDIAKFLIESGADVNLADKYGNLPTEVCVEKLNFEMMQEHP